MKTITIKIKIPTSFSEVRTWRKERISKRYKHNRKILAELEDYICLLRDDKYFMEISCLAKNELAEGPDCRIRRAFKEFVF